jgi:hypothetical protein
MRSDATAVLVRGLPTVAVCENLCGSTPMITLCLCPTF